MRKTKYAWRRDLSIYEEQEMERLSKFANEGWMLEAVGYYFYKFKKTAPNNIKFNLDYRDKPDEEYFDIFQSSDWIYVCSIANWIHFFYASNQTEPIYSDKDTLIEKYETQKNAVARGVIVSVVLSMIYLFLFLQIDIFLGYLSF